MLRLESISQSFAIRANAARQEPEPEHKSTTVMTRRSVPGRRLNQSATPLVLPGTHWMSAAYAESSSVSRSSGSLIWAPDRSSMYLRAEQSVWTVTPSPCRRRCDQ